MSRILVVDDDPDIVFALSLLLKREGYEVATAASRAEGRRVLEAFDPHLIVLDVMMEEADDGIAMAQELRREGRTVPILMLTSVGRVTGLSFDRDDDLVPVEAFVEKPVRPEDLLAKVRELLHQEGARPC
jgi:DNA-binding response OmpR family regulator